MLSVLPDLTPAIPLAPGHPHDLGSGHGHDLNHAGPGGGGGHHHRRTRHLADLTPLARLRADEQNLERRRQNVTNFGANWLKPPLIPKTLHQLREERREIEEHQEAVRREQQLAHELAEAEAAGDNIGGGDVGPDDNNDMEGGDPEADSEGGGDAMDDVQLDGAGRDLDDDIPEAESADFGLGSDNDDDDDDENDEDDEDANDDDRDNTQERASQEQARLLAQRMRETHAAFRSLGANNAVYYGAEDEVDEEDQAQMIDEEDLVRGNAAGDGDMDMDADLDADIPEAGSLGAYEHTDTEAELSSDDDEDDGHDRRATFASSRGHAETSFAVHAPQAARFRGSLARSDVTRHSLAISDMGSSVLGSSPQIGGRPSLDPFRRRRS